MGEDTGEYAKASGRTRKQDEVAQGATQGRSPIAHQLFTLCSSSLSIGSI